jgi:GT2 family glycosyltransferase
MSQAMPAPVAILIVCHNAGDDLRECLESIRACADPAIPSRIIVVDNASTDDSARAAAADPGVELVRSELNLGFAGGNNLGWRHICERYPDFAYVVLLNQDTIVTPGWLRPLIQHLEQDPSVACVQAKLMLYPQKDLINTAGNRSHFLGFGYMTGYLEPDRGQFEAAREIDFPSGAAAAVRADVLYRTGLFDESLFMYMEDVDLGWKLRLAGHRIEFVPGSMVYHKYAYARNPHFYYYLERNRWRLLLTYYRIPTLLLLLPALLAMEGGQLLFAAQNGSFADKLRTYADLLSRQCLREIAQNRRKAQARRVIGDRQFLASFAGAIDSPQLTHPLLRYVANPVLSLYWAIARRLIFW